MNQQEKSAPLLPPEAENGGPLFFVIAIIVFLACLAAVSSHMALQNVQHWKQALRSEMTVQIKSGQMDDAGRADQALAEMAGIAKTSIGSRDEAKALLEPWLGADNIPDDLPIPLLVYVHLSADNPPTAADLTRHLAAIGVDVSVDDHQRWARDLARSARAAQIISIAVLSLLITASIAITGFASRAGLAARRDLVGVLHLVGARDHVIARLFGRRFVMLGLKAGGAGALLAILCLGVLWLSGVGQMALGAGLFRPGFSHMLLLVPAPFLTALVGGWTAYSTVLNRLRKRN